MTIHQKQTTYRKDFSWPQIKTLGQRPSAVNLFVLCECKRDGSGANKPVSAGEQGWTRIGPMGPLIDPKIYPVHVGAAPQTEISRYDQPNVFLQDLERKYPLIFDCGKKRPDDFLAKINTNRLRTTYQVDFCKSAPMTNEDLVRAQGHSGTDKCPPPRRLPGDPCKPYKKNIAFRPGLISGMPFVKKEKLSCPGRRSTAHTGSTEYQDTISRVGHMILMDMKKSKKDRKLLK